MREVANESQHEFLTNETTHSRMYKSRGNTKHAWASPRHCLKNARIHSFAIKRRPIFRHKRNARCQAAFHRRETALTTSVCMHPQDADGQKVCSNAAYLRVIFKDWLPTLSTYTPAGNVETPISACPSCTEAVVTTRPAASKSMALFTDAPDTRRVRPSE